MLLQFLMSIFITPSVLNISRNIIKDSKLQFIPSLLKEKKFNDTVEGLTVFVDEKNTDGTYENIFIRDESKILKSIEKKISILPAFQLW